MTTSRLAQYAARALEVGWLTALLVIPVFFNVWSDRVFEPDKLSLLRSMALLMVAAGAVWLLERGRPPAGAVRRWLRLPIVGPVLLLTAAYLLAAILSVDPRASWLGGHNRLQGVYTWSAYVVLFLAVVAMLRDHLQLDRLLFAVVLPSLPVGLYALLQKLSSPERRLDPMPWLGDTSTRVASTMGNSIFVSAYLILTVPITLVLLARAMRDLDDDDSNTAVLRVSGYLVMLAMQLMTIVLSQSRGPWLGLVGGMFFLLLLLAAWRGRRAMLAVVGIGAVVAAFLVVFNLPSSPLAPLRQVPYVGRLGRVFETDKGTGRVRVLIWGGAAQLVTSDPLRLLMGYGPESMQVAYNPFYPPELANLESRNASPDRSHNETFDVLINAGLLGFAAYLLLFTALFYYGLKWLGFVDSTARRNQFLLFWFGGGLLAVAAFWLRSRDLTYFGVSLPLGMIAGLFAYVVLRTLRGWTPPNQPGSLLLAGLMGAVIAHFIEINLGIAIASTRTVFFVLAAAMVVVGALAAERPALLTGEAVPMRDTAPVSPPVTVSKRKAARRTETRPTVRRGGWLVDAFMVLTLLATLVYTFVVTLTPDTVPGAAMVWLFAFTWGLSSLVLLTEAAMRARRVTTLARPAVGRYVLVTLGGLAVYLLAHAGVLAAALDPDRVRNDPFAGANASSMLLWLFVVVLLALMAGWTYVLTREDPVPDTVVRGRLVWLYPILLLVALGLAVTTNVNVVLADVFYKQAYVNFHGEALRYVDQGDTDTADAYFDLALQHYDRTLALNPRDDYYLLFRGKALLERADAKAQAVEPALNALQGSTTGFSEYAVSDADLAARVTDRDQAFEAALAGLEVARQTAPLNTDHVANLGRAYKFWGDRTMDADKRRERFAKSVEWYRAAIAQSPNNAGLMEELATTNYLAGDIEAALAGISETLKVDPSFTRPLRLLAAIQRDNGQWAAAEKNYRAWVASRDGRSDALGWSGLAMALGRQQRYTEAIAANEQVLKLVPGDTATLKNLVLLAEQSGDRERACQYVAQGLVALPDDGDLQAVAARLDCPPVADGGAP